jgi:hypothetical protein
MERKTPTPNTVRLRRTRTDIREGAWQLLRDVGVAAPIDSEILYYVLIGGASLPYVNAAEVRLLTGRDPKSPTWIDAHADGLVSILLPGLAVSS